MIEPILHSFAYCVGFVTEQVGDIVPGDMAAQPAGIRNHPVWVIGHLAHACELLGGTIGLPPWLPGDWSRRYGTGSGPVADPRVYEPKDEALAILRDAQRRLSHAIGGLEDGRLDAPFPDPSYREVFPSLRHAITQVLVGHPAYHIGQLALWRKAMGLPRLERSFE